MAGHDAARTGASDGPARPAARDSASGAPPHHPDRQAAQAEIHARPISPLSAPTRVRRVALMFGQNPEAVQESRARVVAFCAARGITPPHEGSRRIHFGTDSHEVTWEFHTEFTTVTWNAPSDDWDAWPSGIGLETASRDQAIMAVRVDVVAAAAISLRALAGFDERSLCHASVESGRAEVATDFQTDAHGYTRYEVASIALGPHLLGALVRRLLEIETYRVLALVGIELARSEAPVLGRLETRLAAAMRDIIAAADPAGNAELLDAVHDLQLAALGSEERTRYRFAASHAYGDILLQRLRDLDERAKGDRWLLNAYLRQRTEPALATLEAVGRRQKALLDQTARSTAMLGTRISLDIDTQNRSILETISETGKSQFRLQRTVEGLSTIAIAYYLLGILAHTSHVLPPRYEPTVSVATAILAPLLVLGVWFYLKRVQRR